MCFIDGGVTWADKHRDIGAQTTTGDCPDDYLSYRVENEVNIGICTLCAKNRNMDESNFFCNMRLDGGPHLIDMAAEAKMFNL